MTPRGVLSIAPVNRPGGIAPAAIFFEASASADQLGVERADHDPLYKWTFGEALNGTRREFTYITRGSALWSRDNDLAYGPRVMHVFAEPGTYTVTCEMWTERSAKPFDRAETTVEIAAPEEVHVKTLVLAQDNDFEEAPRGRQVTSIEAALTVLDGSGRLRLKRGETVAFPGHLGGERILIDAWGPEDAPKPILDATRADGLVLREFRGEFALRGVDIVGGCDPVTETGISKGSGITIAGSGHFTLCDVEIRNVWTGIYPRMGDRADPWSLGVANSAIRNWTDYGFLCPRAYHVGWEGVVLSQHVDARGGGMGKVDGKFYNRHGCARYAQPRVEGFVTYHNVEGFSCNGWSRAGDRPSYQPFIRWGSGGTPGMKLNIDRLIAEGAGHGTLLNLESFSNDDEAGNTLIDKAVLIECANSAGAIVAGHGGITGRNILIVSPNVRRENSAPPLLGHIRIKGQSGPRQSAANRATWVHFYGLTLVDLMDPAANGNAYDTGPVDPSLYYYVADGDTFADVYVDNNHLYAPNLARPKVESPAPDLSQVLFPPLYKGLRWHEELLDATTTPSRSVFATPEGTILLPVPRPGSMSYQDADLVGRIPIDDIRGRLRLGTPSQGAVEP